MGLKRINHYVEVLPKMFVGWRIGKDLETLSELPNGALCINLFQMSCQIGLEAKL